MSYDYARLADAIRDARLHNGWSQQELADLAGVFVSTIQNLEGRRRPRKWPPSVGPVARALGKGEDWARAVAEGRSPIRPVERQPAEPRSSLIDPDSPDPVIRELSTGPVRSDEFREELIRLYLDDVARAADRVRRLRKAASSEDSPGEQELRRTADGLSTKSDGEDTAQSFDDPGQEANTA